MKNYKAIFYVGKAILWLLFLGLAFQFQSCKKDDEEVDPDGLIQAINDIVPDTTLNQMIALGMPINRGTTPPSLDKIYKASPFVLVKSNIPNDRPVGSLFADYKFKFYDYDASKFSVKIDAREGNISTSTGIGSFVSGEGNKFTIFAKIFSSSTNGNKSDLLVVMSGEKTTTGIKDFYYSLYMLNDYGDPNNDLIEKGQMRVIKDSDGNSPEVSSLDALVGDLDKKVGSMLEMTSSKK
ncbi:MAG: hypothetical protein MUE85_11515 [Microscillaceae bacterium]|nr:hypothetical protein [Microscillaceae bacterium]